MTPYAFHKKVTPEELSSQMLGAALNPFLHSLMSSMKSLIAILNIQRQLIAVNDELLNRLGFNSLEDVVGLRPGEFFGCAFQNNSPKGCGCSKVCGTCGALKAKVSAIKTNQKQWRSAP